MNLHGSMFYRYIRFIAHAFVRGLFHLQVCGKDNFYKVKGAILAVNHSSYLDPVFASVASPRPIYFLARKDLFEFNKFFGWLIGNVHAIPFSRDVPDTKAIRNVINLLQHGQIVLIFPEGTRSFDGNLLPGQPGIGFIALKAGVPIVPMYIKGAHKILPRNASFIKLRKARVYIGEPIYPQQTDYQEIANLVMGKIRKLS